MPQSFDLAVSETLLELLIITGLFVLVLVIIRALTTRYIRKNVHSAELRRRWLVQSRNALILILLLGLVLIWADELRTLALSIVAIAVAFVVATKELILCLTGSILKTGSRSFNVGDRIQVKDFRGDVIDQNLLATTILEVGPGKITHQRTGRMTTIPNALFLSEPVINESFTHDYVLHVFTVPFKMQDDWKKAQKLFLESSNRHCSPYIEEVRKYMKDVSEDRGLEVPSVDPRVTIQVPVAGEVHLIIRIPTRSGQRSFIEQAILADVLTSNNFQALGNRDEAVVQKPASEDEPET